MTLLLLLLLFPLYNQAQVLKHRTANHNTLQNKHRIQNNSITYKATSQHTTLQNITAQPNTAGNNSHNAKEVDVGTEHVAFSLKSGIDVVGVLNVRERERERERSGQVNTAKAQHKTL